MMPDATVGVETRGTWKSGDYANIFTFSVNGTAWILELYWSWVARGHAFWSRLVIVATQVTFKHYCKENSVRMFISQAAGSYFRGSLI